VIVSGGAGVAGGTAIFTGCVTRFVSAPVLATISYVGLSAGGFGSHAMNAPLGHTGEGVPLIVKAASPLPTLPKMKFESFD
jgi:hypothetical protein